MAIIRTVTGVNDGSELFTDQANSSTVNNNASRVALNQKGSSFVNAQGFIAYITNYYNFDGSNPIQQLEADTFTDLEPTIAQIFDERTEAMKSGSPDGYLLASHEEHGHSSHGANHFSLAGLENGSFCTVRILYNLTPEIDESSSQVRLHFSTNTSAQATGLTEFTIESQSLIMSQGANQSYSDENLVSFFVGDTLSGLTEADAGSFHISIKSTVEADLEVLGVTLYANV